MPWVAQGRCESGKEIAKAQTEGMKRFEMKLFHASTKNDIDPDGEHIVTGKQEVKTAPKQAPKQATPNAKQMSIIKHVQAVNKLSQINAPIVNSYLSENTSLKTDFMKASDTALDIVITELGI